MSFGVSGEPLEASGVWSSTSDPFGSLSVKMPPEGGVFTFERRLMWAFYQSQYGSDKMPPSGGVLSLNAT